MAESDPPEPEKEEAGAEEPRWARRNDQVRAYRSKLRRRLDPTAELAKAIDDALASNESVRRPGKPRPTTDEPKSTTEPGALAGGGGEGFGMTVRGGHREIPGYPVTDDDLENLASDTEEMRTNIGVVSFCLSLLVTIVIDGWLLATEVSPTGGAFRIIGPLVAVVLMVVFFLRYRHYRRQHRTRLKRIKDETRRA